MGNGVRFNEVIFLTGARPLDQRIEEIAPGCVIEGMCDRRRCHDGALETVSSFCKSDLEASSASEIPLEEGSYRRPTMTDTFRQWMSTEVNEGPHLIITNQPYCCYFESIAGLAFPRHMKVKVVGAGTDPEYQKTGALLDNLARLLFNEA